MRSAVSRSRLARGSAAASLAGSTTTPRWARASLTRAQFGLTRTPPASRKTASRAKPPQLPETIIGSRLIVGARHSEESGQGANHGHGSAASQHLSLAKWVRAYV